MTKYFYCWSGGKDSSATIALAHEIGAPKGTVLMSEVMFDKDISGELPEHMEWVHNTAVPLFEEWGFEVKILRSKYTYLDCFHKVNQGMRTPERAGMKYGFPMSGKCIINGMCKMKPLRDYFKTIEGDYIQYVGIALDEQKRLARILKDRTKVSLLANCNYTEKDAYDLCEKYNLISPYYQYSKRGGCWFCPNARDCQLRHVRNNHPQLWKRLLELEDEENLVGDIWDTRNRISIHQKELQFREEDGGMIYGNIKF